MVGDPHRPGAARLAVGSVPWSLLALLGLYLALGASPGWVLGGIVLGTGLGAALALVLLFSELGRTVAVVPAVAALGVLAAWARVNPLDELVAGGAGISLLLLLASGPGAGTSLADAAVLLLLPSLAVLLAVVTGFALPGISGQYGAAAALLAAVLLLAGWLYARPSELGSTDRTAASATS